MPGPPKQPNRDSELHRVVSSAPDLAATTKDRYLRDLNKWIDFAGANPSGWTYQNAQDFYSMLLSEGMKPQSATRLFASVQYAARWWTASINRPDLNFTHIRLAKPTRAAHKPFIEAAEAIRLLNGCERDEFGTRDFAMIVMGLETGMRRMSLSAVRAEHVGAESCRAPIKGSNGELVEIPLSPTVIAALGPWRAIARGRGPLFRPLLPKLDAKGNARVTVIDRNLSEGAIYMMVRERCKRIGLHGHPHLFRHTFITWRSQQGYAPHEIAAVTHHTVGLGALESYIDKSAFAPKMRASTPIWLQELVERRVSNG